MRLKPPFKSMEVDSGSIEGTFTVYVVGPREVFFVTTSMPSFLYDFDTWWEREHSEVVLKQSPPRKMILLGQRCKLSDFLTGGGFELSPLFVAGIDRIDGTPDVRVRLETFSVELDYEPGPNPFQNSTS